jgi:hypothetical protein
MVGYIYYITAAGNSISLQLGQSKSTPKIYSSLLQSSLPARIEAETVFFNFKGAQESIPRNRSSQPT